MISNTRINNLDIIKTPLEIKEKYQLSQKNINFINNSRQIIKNILRRENDKFVVIIGPCSIHDINSAKEYSNYFKNWQSKFSDKIFLIMRVYFEKPRTTIGWKGYINDPDLNGKYNINKGLEEARKLMLYFTDKEIPIACEFLDVFTPQYIGDLVTWGCIGARTCESQLHRQLASGLSMPIGFKNPTTGFPEIAIESIISSRHPHIFLGIDDRGQTSFIETKGNRDCHIVLRGTRETINYSEKDVINVEKILLNNTLFKRIMIDCSHDNCRKNYKLQENVLKNIILQINAGNNSIFGLMLESNIKEGSQKLSSYQKLEYGKSITDGCISVEKSEELLNYLHKNISNRYILSKL